MKKKNKVLLTSMATIAMCASLVAGGTYALFTSESAVNIAISSATVNVVATVDETSVKTKQLYDTEYTQGADNMYEGVATFGDYGLTLEKLVPGDGIQFNIVVANESNVTVQYRTIISCDSDDGLFAGLKINVGDNENYSGVTLVADWATLAVDAEDAIVPVTIELPEGAGNEYQGKSCTITYKVEAVQGNAEVENPKDDTIYVYNVNDFKALSGKYLVANNGKAEIQNVELLADVDMKGAEFQEIGVAYGDTMNFKGNGHSVSNMKLATSGKHNGMTNVGMFYVDSGATLNVENLTLVAPVVEDAIDKYAIGAAAVVGYANGAVNLTDVDVENAKINNTFGNAAVFVGYCVNPVALVDCDIIGADTIVSGEIENGAVRMDKTGAFFGTVNTASCVATLTNCTNESSYNIAGRVITDATLTVDGAYYVTTANGFTSALASGDTVNIILADGKYENVLTAAGKTINVIGENEDGAEIALTNAVSSSHDHLGLGECTVTLENVKATFEDDAYYAAYINQPTMTYKNCTLIGQQYIYGNTSFINCVFDNDDDAAVSAMRYTYIYDGDVVVDNCDFYTQGHGLIMFSDNGGAGDQTLTVKNSRFHGGQGRTAWAVANQNTAAIEIDGSCGANYTLILEGENTVDGGFSGLWRIKAMKDTVNTTVNGTVYNGTSSDVYLDGDKYTKNADGNVAKDGYTYVADGLIQDTAGVYYITSAKGFDAMRTMVDGEEAYEKDGTWVLENDVDLNGINWTPIAGFHGTFDGNDKTISNMNASFLAENELGLDHLVECVIKDVTFHKASITGTEYVGVVVSNAHGLTIENVKVTDSTVIGAKYVGGIIGAVNKGVSTVTGCSVENSTIKAENVGEVAANGKVGGIVGFLSVGKATGNAVSGCTISGPECVGGIVGRGGSGDGAATIYGNTVSNNSVTGTNTDTVGEQIGDALNVEDSE